MKRFMSGFFSLLFLGVLGLNGGIMTTANAQDQNIWNPMFDEIRMTRKPNNQTVYQDIMTFKFGNNWAPYPFKVNLDNATIALFPKIKGPNDPTGTLEWDQNWKGEIWTADRSTPEVNANLIFTFDKNTETIIIPRDRIYDTTQLIVRLKGFMPDGSEILYDQFFLSLSTDPGETSGEIGGGGEVPSDPTIVIQVPCYVSSLAPYSSLVESSGGIIDFMVNTSLNTCSWTPSTTSDFIVVPENSYTGSKTVSVSVMENTSTEPRVGSVVVDGYEFTIFQKGVPIDIPEPPDYGYSTTITPANIIVGTNESTGSFEVVVGKEDAEWNVVSDGFLIVEGPTTRTGNSIVNYRIPENTSQEGRVGTITAAGGKFFVYQRGVGVSVVETSEFITEFIPEYSAHSYKGSTQTESYIGEGSTLNELVDDGGMVWTVVEGVVKVNGENAGFSQNVVTLLWYQGKVYQSNQDGGWWRWDGNGIWTPIPSGDPRGTTQSNSFLVKTSEQDTQWNATLNLFGADPWVNLIDNQGIGDGVVTYTLSENPSSTPRFAEIKVTTDKGYFRVFLIVQEGSPIVIPEVPDYGYSTTINPANIIVGTNESTGSFDVVVGNQDAEWNIEVDDFLVVEGPTTRTGNSTINYRILENTSQEGRVGSIVAAGGRFFVYQRGVVPPPVELSKFITQFTPEYSAKTYQASSGADSFSVKTNKSDCQWNATVNTFGSEPWVVLTNGSGNGDGAVTYTVSENQNFIPRFAEIKVTTSDGYYRVFPIAQEAAPQPYVVEWGRRFLGPTLEDFSVNVSSYTTVGPDAQEVKIGLKVANADNMTWQLWVSPWQDTGQDVSRAMIATGVGNSWDNVSYEDAITLNIPQNNTYNPRVFKAFLVFLSTVGDPITTKREYHIIQRGQKEIVTETVEIVTEVPAKFIKNVVPPFTVVQGTGGDFQFEVQTSISECAWQATTDVDWVGFIVPQPAGVLVPVEMDLLPKSRSFVGSNNLAFRVSENNTSDVRICVIPMSVWPNGFSQGGFEASGAFVNSYHTIIQVPKPGAIRLIIDGKVDVIPTSNIPFNVNVTYEPTPNP